jgi:tRNA threonylcarbamoyladenosine biosynthesis protein TsaB
MPSAPAPQPPVNLLAFDTSTERLAVALQARGGPWHLVADGGAAASATLLPQALRLLAGAGLAATDLQFIAYGRGPGAFTGLRTACAVAQGLGFGLDVPLLAIDSLLIVAEDARLQATVESGSFDIGVAMDARMGEAYAAVYRWHSGAWQVLQAPALTTLPALAQAWQGLTLQAVAGTGWAAFEGRLAVPVGAAVFSLEHDRAAALLRLAVRAAAAGDGIDAADALPLYLRDKVALTTHEREAVRAAATAALP